MVKTSNHRKNHVVDRVIDSYTFQNGNVSFANFSKSNLINFFHTSEAMWPVAHEHKSPLGKSAEVGVQIPVRANFF